MKLRTAGLILLMSAAVVFADPTIESVQQALKDQGFYYGDTNGSKDADTTAAIRRYQIRNGLQITGDLNDETLKSLGVDSSGGRAVVKASPTVAPPSDTPALKAPLKQEQEPEPEHNQMPINPMTGQPFPEPQREDRRPHDESAVPMGPAGNFAGTPFQGAPPEVQRNVVVAAQNILAQRGLYRGPLDGMISPDFEFSMRAYQARVHLPVTGRLDLPTLAALELLPGGNRPVYLPRRRPPQEPVHGEWIHEH